MISYSDSSRLRALTNTLLAIFSCGVCIAEEPAFGPVEEKGTVSVPGLVEASGLVVSRVNPGVFWTHNDKGGNAEVFAFGIDGLHLGTFGLPGSGSIDYEDMAMGPGPVKGVDYLYVGDIGDGNKNPIRESIQVYRFPEPAVRRELSANPVRADLAGVVQLDLQYPDGAKNAEAMTMDPLTGDLYLIPRVKAPAKAGVYRASREQLLGEETIVMTRTGWVDFDVASGGAISPTGREIALRQETFAHIWTRAAGQTIAGAMAADPISLPIVGKPVEKNGEAIAFDPDGRGYFTLSDSLASQPLRYFPRTSQYSDPVRMTIDDPDSSWTYLSDGFQPTAGWKELGFDDAQWDLGQTPVNFSESPIATYAFRREFESAVGGAAEIILRHSGSARVFLNGDLAGEMTMPAASAGTWQTLSLGSSALLSGANVVAIELARPDGARKPFIFDAQLVSLRALPQRTGITSISIEDMTVTLTVESPEQHAQIQSSSNLTDWTNTEPVELEQGSARLELQREAPSDARYFRAVPIRP